MFGRTGNAKSTVTQASAWVTYLLLAIGIVSPVVCVVWLVRTAVENENAVVRRLVSEANERRLADAAAYCLEIAETLVPELGNGVVAYSWGSSGEVVAEGESERARAALESVREDLKGEGRAARQLMLAGYLRDSDLSSLRLSEGRRLGALLLQLGLREVRVAEDLEDAFRVEADRYVVANMQGSDLSRQHRYLLRQYAPLSGSKEVAAILEREGLVDRWIAAVEAEGMFPPELGLGHVDGLLYYRESDAESVRIFRQADWREKLVGSEAWREFGVSLVDSGVEANRARPLPAPLGFLTLELDHEELANGGATSDKAVLYLWIGGIVLGLSILSGVAIVASVRRQASVTQLKDNLVATVTHELKTPVSSIRLLIDTLMDETRRDKVNTQEYIELISRENERLGRLIDNFLSFSRMERSKGSFDIQRISPAAVLRAVEQAFRERFKGQAYELSVEGGECLPDILGDPDALATVLGNLLENAFKYGGRSKRIELSGKAAAGGVEFEVRDFGKGIGKRDQKRIFRKFFQVDHHASGQTGSVGLGLSIVEFIVSKHSGQIELESELGKGSVFRVRIPYA
ncbi:HAMP domain-containing sensor histidine kinase [Pelagicoccus sp. SDUM812005]|uniref:sensor histidine kinase n=1 Tax=Pelagicoccus sp. SDUM812005 TaxID=3041257 RepID=UPI00280DA9A2|nr:HAMP domain-containing sensor histidine kinase [Pelagicoccus sp. SDUM812005]MDQ8179085.1 HAMP domain-containing sensor histidine kinase [Pelagicoccus sp. SDUM812005]